MIKQQSRPFTTGGAVFHSRKTTRTQSQACRSKTTGLHGQRNHLFVNGKRKKGMWSMGMPHQVAHAPRTKPSPTPFLLPSLFIPYLLWINDFWRYPPLCPKVTFLRFGRKIRGCGREKKKIAKKYFHDLRALHRTFIKLLFTYFVYSLPILYFVSSLFRLHLFMKRIIYIKTPMPYSIHTL